MALAEGVATRHKSNGLFHRHPHPGKRIPHFRSGGHGIRIAMGALRIHVNQPHFDSSQRLVEPAIAVVAFIRQMMSDK